MSNPDSAGKSARVSEQAFAWLVTFASREVSEAQRREFRAWLAQSPAHRAAWNEARSFSAGMDKLPADDIAEILRLGLPSSTAKPLRKQRCGMRLALAVSLFLAVGFWIRGHPAFYADQYTQVGEQRNLTLADGSTVILNTDTAISLDFGPDARRLELHQGEAYFHVAADAKRPFEVVTAYGSIRALGTAFNVRSVGGTASVTVYEHAVSVTLNNGRQLPRLEKGKRVDFNGQTLEPAESANLFREGAWRQHELIVEDRPLAEVVKELNRYRPGGISIVDAGTARQRVTGSIDTRAPDQALQNIIESLPVSSRRVAGRWVFLYSRQAAR